MRNKPVTLALVFGTSFFLASVVAVWWAHVEPFMGGVVMALILSPIAGGFGAFVYDEVAQEWER